MSLKLTSAQVWEALENEIFAVLGMVSARGQARTVGINYIVNNGKLYISSSTDAWKVRHTQNNPHVSLTVPIAKRVPFMPWMKIPPAAISFSGVAEVVEPEALSEEVAKDLFRGMEADAELIANYRVIVVEPVGDFITYGVGVSLLELRDPKKARGRAPVA
jgi:hypothetical protein